MLTDVTIEGLRGVGNVELHFVPGQRVYTLFGENGVGKTKCLEALYRLLLAGNEINAAKKSKSYLLQIILPVLDKMFCKTADGVLISCGEVWHDSPVVFLGASRRANLTRTDQLSLHTEQPLGSFEKRHNEYFNLLAKAFLSGNLSSLGMSDDTRAWFVRRTKATNPYNISRGKWEAEISAVLSMLHEIEPRISLEGFHTDESDSVFLTVDGEERELGALSFGYAALVKMVQAIVEGYGAFTNEDDLRNVSGIVLIDEIDAHLHLRWQTKIIQCLKKLLPNTTFYVATHSPLVLSQLKDGEAYLLRRDNDGVVRSKNIDLPNRQFFVDMLEAGFGIDINNLEPDNVMEQNAQQKASEQKLLSLLESLKTQEGAEA